MVKRGAGADLNRVPCHQSACSRVEEPAGDPGEEVAVAAHRAGAGQGWWQRRGQSPGRWAVAPARARRWPESRSCGPRGGAAAGPSPSGAVSGSAFACSVPPGRRFSRPIAGRRLGRWMMSRLAGFYIATVMQSAAAGTTAAAASRTPPRQASDHAAIGATRTHSRSPATQRVTAAAHRTRGGLSAASRHHPELGQLPPPEPARQPSGHYRD